MPEPPAQHRKKARFMSATPPTDLERVFGASGMLAAKVAHYRPRAQQLEMAERVAAAIRDNGILVCEAGTGTGKTFGYLVPALLGGGKVIVSTGTKTLQDQLFRRDLPLVRDALGVSVDVALLKGRANYVCRYHLERNLADGRLASREDAAQLQRIGRFARVSTSGDRGELAEVPEDAPAWALATSTRENCLGQACPRYDQCFVMAARRQALAADIIVVNHHLFFADLALKDDGMAELLPACNTVVFDEAHQLPQTATLFFGETLSTGQLLELSRDARGEALAAAADVPDLAARIGSVEKAARELRLSVPQENTRFAARALDGRREFASALDAAQDALAALGASLEAVAERSEGLARCASRAGAALDLLLRWREGDGERLVRWVEVYSHSLALNATPLSIAPLFRKQLDGRPRSWIFVSATLAVAGDFSLYCAEMGLDGSSTACWDSPFDYVRNAMLYVPRGLPDPSSADHTRAVVDAAFPVLRASRGRAFFLFTTLRAMRLAHQLLREALARERLAYPLLLQGEGSRSELLERFRRLGDAILVGSASFWEGVDVRGEALSLVVIDKLPFAPPDDPVLAARLQALEREGRNPFVDYQLPQAAIALKQGAGRLIRDEADRGVLMICDPRLFSKAYGRRILASLPPMKPSRDQEEATAFFADRATTPSTRDP
jgi:ATP-dependent DNA helicase DinG